MAENRFLKYAQPQGIMVRGPDPMQPINVAKGREDLADAPIDRAGKAISNDRAAFDLRQAQALAAAQRRKAAAEAALAETNLATAKNKADANGLNPGKLRDVRIDAASKINTIRAIRRELDSMSFPNVTGVGLGDWMKAIPGTGARGIDAKIKNLQAGGALAEVLKMSAQTGRNPFTPMSNSDVQLISQNIGNLDQGQGLHDFIGQLDAYERAYGNAFVGAGGSRKLLSDRNRGDGPFPGKGQKAAPQSGPKGVSVSNW